MTRRTFFNWIARTLHVVVTLLVGAPVIRFLVGRHGPSESGGSYQRIAPLSGAHPDHPERVTVSADRTDAFTHYPPGPIGVVWLVRSPDLGGIAQVKCFQSSCPHLGCAIDFARDRGVFFCPCHASEFALDGSRHFGPTPRGMDELPCRVTEPDDDGERWVEIKYQEFQTGTDGPVPSA